MRSHYTLISSSESTVSYNRNEREKDEHLSTIQKASALKPIERGIMTEGLSFNFLWKMLPTALTSEWVRAKMVTCQVNLDTERWAPNEILAVSRIPVCCFSPDLSFVCLVGRCDSSLALLSGGREVMSLPGEAVLSFPALHSRGCGPTPLPLKICTSAPQFTRPSSLLGPFDRHPFYLKQLFILGWLTPNTKH